jgi:hypothetical protein
MAKMRNYFLGIFKSGGTKKAATVSIIPALPLELQGSLFLPFSVRKKAGISFARKRQVCTFESSAVFIEIR